MKLNLLLTKKETTKSGYLNISPFSTEQDGSVVMGSVTDLSWAAEAAQCSEIVAYDLIDFLPEISLHQTISHWCSRLAHKGTLLIGGVDLYDCSRRLQNRTIMLPEYRELIYGERLHPFSFRRSTSCRKDMVTLLLDNGLRIVEEGITNSRYWIKGERP